ncbi:MAG TPA: sigma-70 family RNA polymerase sigma factor [Vicinamibacterales bacterium]
METDGITQLLRRASAGDAGASDELLPIVYAELHRVARRHLQGERRDHTLQATALVNEAYLRIFGGSQAQFPDRAHFLAFASKAMRNILVDHARARQADKRGGDLQRVPVDDALTVALDSAERLISLLDLNAAIDALADQHPSAARAVEMRYFGGMTAEETAQAVGQSVHVVQHDLRFAHAWLRRRLEGDAAD